MYKIVEEEKKKCNRTISDEKQRQKSEASSSLKSGAKNWEIIEVKFNEEFPHAEHKYYDEICEERERVKISEIEHCSMAYFLWDFNSLWIIWSEINRVLKRLKRAGKLWKGPRLNVERKKEDEGISHACDVI